MASRYETERRYRELSRTLGKLTEIKHLMELNPSNGHQEFRRVGLLIGAIQYRLSSSLTYGFYTPPMDECRTNKATEAYPMKGSQSCTIPSGAMVSRVALAHTFGRDLIRYKGTLYTVRSRDLR